MKTPTIYEEWNLFRQVINEINKIDFNDSTESHLFNDIYESLLKELQSAGDAGEYYTPRAVTQFMTTLLILNWEKVF